jgi:hypothetical protein
MKALRRTSVLSVVIGIVIGTLVDPVDSGTNVLPEGGYVLAADLHVHAFFGDGGLPPWEIAAEARRRGLDVIALTNHNQILAARIGAWAGRASAPLMLVGEEITASTYHLVAVGISRAIGWRQSAAEAIAAVHAQGGVAIAAHPVRRAWDAFDERAMTELDGIETAQPVIYLDHRAAGELAEFGRRVKVHNPEVAPIGSSDFHHRAPLGLCRTYVLAEERSEDAVLEAIRRGRTVAYDFEGRAYGDSTLIEIVDRHRRETSQSPSPAKRIGHVVSVAVTLAGLLGLVLFGR